MACTKWVLPIPVSLKIIKGLNQNIVLHLKWRFGAHVSQEHVVLLMPSPSAITARTFMNMFDFKKWIKWRDEQAYQTLLLLENEISLLSDDEKKTYPKKLTLNQRLRDLGFIDFSQDIEYVFKRELYAKAIFEEHGISDLINIQRIRLD